MNRIPNIVFVCEHGAAKSIVAAAYLNKFASEVGLDLHAVARGTNPDDELSPQAIEGLRKDYLSPTESVPQKLTLADMQSAQRVVTFCDLPVEYQVQVSLERWDDVPSVSENYAEARDAIVKHIYQTLKSLS